MRACRVCNNCEGNYFFVAREMLKGTRAVFQYMECGACRCLQIISPPEDMSGYYDNHSYGSFLKHRKFFFKDWIRRVRNRYSIRRIGGLAGLFLSTVKPIPRDFTIVGEYATTASRILDVGCGAGSYVNDLREIGFKNAAGIDPYIKENLYYTNGTVILKSYIEDVSDSYDVILSHHSLEHVPNPLGTLIAIRQRLSLGGICILTVPVAESLYRKYKSDCYLIQAPQHFYLFSIKSINILAMQAGFSIESIIREADTNFDWYVSSELWSQNIASNEFKKPITGSLSESKLLEFKHEILKLKKEKLGDNVIFILRN
jgi:2-polyprenyl-3-methyl-5-hydroxy-6-metoxy-1,4-benzoquinol methylase